MALSPAQRHRDVSTVISIIPTPIHEFKPGLIPGEFKIPGVEREGDFNLLVVERCIHAVYLDEARPRLIVPDPSDVVAESIVMDYKQSIHGYVPGEAEPGIHWVSGEYPNNEEGKKLFAATHASLLKDMTTLQLAWFTTLVSFADDDWERYGSHKLITKLQKVAAIRLGLTKKVWVLEQQVAESMSRCKFCFQMVDPRAIICSHCHGVLDTVRYEKEYQAQSLAVAGKK